MEGSKGSSQSEISRVLGRLVSFTGNSFTVMRSGDRGVDDQR